MHERCVYDLALLLSVACNFMVVMTSTISTQRRSYASVVVWLHQDDKQHE